MRAILAVIIVAAALTEAAAADLSERDLRALLAASGFNPGTSRAVGSFGVQTLTKVSVSKGARRGDFVIRVHIVGSPKQKIAEH